MYDIQSGSKVAELDSTGVYEFYYAWPYPSEFRVGLTVIEPDGDYCITSKDYLDEDCFERRVVGGGAPALDQNVQRQEEQRCEVIINRVYFEDTEPPPAVKLKMRGGVKFD